MQRPLAIRLQAYRTLRRRPWPAVAEVLVPIVRARFGDREAAALLAACGSNTVARRLPGLAHAVTNWRGFGRRHPAVLLDLVDSALDAVADGGWSFVLQRFAGGIWAAAVAEIPGATPRIFAGPARSDRDRVLTVLADPRFRGTVPAGRTLWHSLRTADEAALISLARRLPTHQVWLFLRQIAPARRPAIYHGVTRGRDPMTAGLPVIVLDLLPLADRAAEAGRCLQIPQLTDDQDRRLEMSARLRNELDPVRQVALSALSTVPGRLLSPEAVRSLQTLLSDAVMARDASNGTRSAVGDLAVLVLREGLTRGIAWVRIAVGAFEALLGSWPSPNLGRLEQNLPRGAEQLLWQAFRDRIAAASPGPGGRSAEPGSIAAWCCPR